MDGTPSTSSTIHTSIVHNSCNGEMQRSGEWKMDQLAHFEVLHLIERFLAGGNFDRTAALLRKEINERNLVPSRLDYNGQPHDRTYNQFMQSLWNVPMSSLLTSSSLPSIIARLSHLSDSSVPPPLPHLPIRLFTSSRSAIDRQPDVLLPPSQSRLLLGPRGCLSTSKVPSSPLSILNARQLGYRIPRHRLPPPSSVELIERHFRVLGHLANVFCVAFDRTGNYVITGADDNLVKVWNGLKGILRFTYRGHWSEITDLSVSHCNTLVASGSVDKTVRVWRLQNGETLAVYKHHTAMVSYLSFLPFLVPGSDMRYLVTTSYDCTVNFYKWNAKTLEIPEFPIQRYFERDQPGARIVSLTHSASGKVVAVGESHGIIRVYIMNEEGVSKMGDITAHSDRVDSLEWAHSGLKFVSGCKDGLTKVWRYEYGEWTGTILSLSQAELLSISGSTTARNNPNSKNNYKVSTLCWSGDDSKVITTGSDYSLRVWDSMTGVQLIRLSVHSNDSFCLCSHPIHPQFILSAGHDGFIQIIDIVSGKVVQKWYNLVEHNEHAAVYDMVISQDGNRIAVVDNKGHISLYALGPNHAAKKMPRFQFFNTDYQPLIADEGGFAIDEDTGMAPHLMPPPLLIDHDGNVHDEELQILVAGRDEDDEDARMICPWLKRNIVPPLDKNELNSWMEQAMALVQVEKEEYEREKGRQRPIVPSLPIPIIPLTKKKNRPYTRSTLMNAVIARTEAAVQARTANRRRNREEQVNGVEHSAEDELDRLESASSSDVVDDSDENTSDTDFSVGDTRREREERRNEQSSSQQANTRRRRERELIELVDDEEEEPIASTSRERRRRNEEGRKPKDNEDEFGNDLSIDMFDVPSTSTGRRRQNGTRKKEVKEKSVQRKSEERNEENEEIEQTRMRRKRNDGDNKWMLTFPSWMNEVKRRRFPYIAQLGDHVMYFKQGHDNYLQQVERVHAYNVTCKMRPRPELNAQELAIVDDVRYTRSPYRLTVLKLERIEYDGRRTGLTWTVKYHDMENVPDFLLLRSHYDESIGQGFDVGDGVEAPIDGMWWTGTVEDFVRDEQYPNSHWMSLKIRWDSGDEEPLSPWDIRKKSANRRGGGGQQTAITEDDYLNLASYVSMDGDWPDEDDDGEMTKRRITDAIHTLTPLNDVTIFSTAVSLVDFPEYASSIDYPIDLDTICERISNGFYRRLIAIQHDIRYIALNAESFNDPISQIVFNAKVLVESIIRFSNDSSLHDIVSLFEQCHHLSADELVEYKRRPRVISETLRVLMLERNGEEVEERRVPGWIAECIQVFDQVCRERCSRHFISSTESSAELAALWEVCEDLTTVRARLNNNDKKYSGPKDVAEEVEELVTTVKQIVEDRRNAINKDCVSLGQLFSRKLQPIIDKFEAHQASVSSHIGMSERQLRRRADRETHHHHYRTRRSDQQALLSVQAAVQRETMQPSTSHSGRVLSHPQTGFYRAIVSGRGYEENAMEEEPRGRTTRARRAVIEDEEEEGEEEDNENEDAEEEEEEEDGTRRQRGTKRKRIQSYDEEDEDEERGSPASSMETRSTTSTRVSVRSTRKRGRVSPDEDCSMRRRPQRAAARQAARHLGESEDEEDTVDTTPTVSSRGRIRKPRLLT